MKAKHLGHLSKIDYSKLEDDVLYSFIVPSHPIIGGEMFAHGKTLKKEGPMMMKEVEKFRNYLMWGQSKQDEK
jgi:hypothetical protein